MKIQFTLLSLIFAASALADENFSKYDANRDESVTYVEYATAQKKAFDMKDRDRSKSLTMTEYGQDPETSEYDLFALPKFAEMDANSNKIVELAELGAAVKGVFDKLDAVKDGQKDKVVAKADFLTAVEQKKEAAAALAASKQPKGSQPKGSEAKKKGSEPKPKTAE